MFRHQALALILSLALCACSSTPETKVAEAPPSPPPPKPAPRAEHYEPGSLWSEGSRWNDIYSAAPSRFVGDTLVVRLTPAIRRQLPQSGTANAPADPRELASTPETIEATISEILPRGVFKIAAAQSTPGSSDKRFSLEGHVRERDINSDDTVSADSIFNMRLEGAGPPADALGSPSPRGPEEHKRVASAETKSASQTGTDRPTPKPRPKGEKK